MSRPVDLHVPVDQAKYSKSESPDTESECLLPLPLQDLCLLKVINDLDSYPVKLLALLPHWLRYRLLNNIPVLDLCHLEHTSVARGVDTDEIWSSRWERSQVSESIVHTLSPVPRSETLDNDSSVFQLSICQSDCCTTHDQLDMDLAIRSLVKDFISEPVKSKEKFLLDLAKGVIKTGLNTGISHQGHIGGLIQPSSHSQYACTRRQLLIDKLISISGETLLWNLTGSVPLHPRAAPCAKDCSCRVLTVQTTALSACRSRNVVQLTPHRLLPIRKRNNLSELLLLLTKDCGLNPTSVNLDVSMVSETTSYPQNILHRFTLSFRTIRCFLEQATVLRLLCQQNDDVETLNAIITGRILSQLKCLFCTTTDLEHSTVQQLSALYSLQHFHQLHLTIEMIHPSIDTLMKEFMTAPCSHTQHLIIHTEGGTLPFTMDTRQLATMDMGGATVPDCACQHKMLQFTSQDTSTNILHPILQFPTIRLNELILNCFDDYYPYLHLCACHPDLQVAKLAIDLNEQPYHILMTTVKNDLISLFKMLTLQELSISGHWVGFENAKHGLVLALYQRSTLCSLRKVTLDLIDYNREEFKELWDALFSLPQLHQLEIALGEEFTMKAVVCTKLICESWTQCAFGEKLKMLHLTGSEHEIICRDLSPVACSVSFTNTQASHHTLGAKIPKRRRISALN